MNTQIKSFEDACKALNLNPELLPEVSMLPEKHQGAITAHYKLTIISEALNKEVSENELFPNWNDTNQRKYFPWFEVQADEDNPAGVGLSYYDYGGWYSTTDVGSRLCYASRELAEYAGTQFKELYEQLFLIK